MNALICRLSSLGDVVCSLPTAVALRRTFPDSHITWVVDPRFADVVDRCASVDEVVRARPRLSLDSIPTFDRRFDVALDVQGLLKSAMVVGRTRADRKLGYHWQREGAGFFSSPVRPDPTSLHIVDQYVDVARAAGAEMDLAEFDLAPTNEDLTNASALVEGRTNYVVVNPGAAWATKRWPADRFAELTTRLASEGVDAVVIGGKSDSDRAVADAVRAAGGEFVDAVGKTSIGDLIGLISGARAHVGGDTGSSHIAAALGKPAIGLYSITRPIRSCPYGQIERCHHDPRGLEFIEVDPVFRTLMEAMS